MTDSTQIPKSLTNLGDVIKTIERESGQPSQLVVKVGDDKYLIGDLRKRAGEYQLEMQDEYHPEQFERGKKVKNPHKKLAGSYDSFDALDEVVKKTQKQQEAERELFRRNRESIYLIGSPDHGYSVAVPGMNLGSAGGQIYNSIGRIIFPLLQDEESISVDKIEK
ncbi:MAG: hypothetical protein AABX44_00890 [Nanoarchaeota archaeon]